MGVFHKSFHMRVECAYCTSSSTFVCAVSMMYECLYRNNGVVIGERLAGKGCLHVRCRGSTLLCDGKNGRQTASAATSTEDIFHLYYKGMCVTRPICPTTHGVTQSI